MPRGALRLAHGQNDLRQHGQCRRGLEGRPVAHPANVLIMGPGGYRFVDYVKVGLPLSIDCLVVTLLVPPLVWPLSP